VEAPLVVVALPEGRGDPFEHPRVEPEAPELLGELLHEHLFPRVAFRAAALVLVARTMVVDVPAAAKLAALEFADHRAAAVAALDETREGELVTASLGSLGVAPVEDILDALPEFGRDQGLVRASMDATAPLEVTGVDPLAEDTVHSGRGDERAALAERQAAVPGHAA
jgi:hypothetical protein